MSLIRWADRPPPPMKKKVLIDLVAIKWFCRFVITSIWWYTHFTLITCNTPVTDGDIMLCNGFPIGSTVPRTMAYGTFRFFCAPTYSLRLLSMFNCGASYNMTQRITKKNWSIFALNQVKKTYLQGFNSVLVAVIAFETQSKDDDIDAQHDGLL